MIVIEHLYIFVLCYITQFFNVSVLKKYKINLMMEPEVNLNKTVWDPLQIFRYSSHHKYAVVILNSSLFWKHDVLLRIWENGMLFMLCSYLLASCVVMKSPTCLTFG